jgi:DNA-binding transcriptional LysR family regulator
MAMRLMGVSFAGLAGQSGDEADLDCSLEFDNPVLRQIIIAEIATMDRIDSLRAFVAVAHAGSFAAAARQLRMSPSLVTRAVAQLEAELGVTLFARTTRVVRLTERGAIHLDSSRRLLDDWQAAVHKVRGEDAAPRGTLSVAAPLLFGRLHIQPIIAGLLAAHPQLQARLVLSDRNVHLVDDGFDAAVRIGTLPDSSLMATRLGEVCRATVASPAYLAARGTPAVPGELAGHDLIAFENLEANNDWHFGGDGVAAEAVRIVPRLTVNSADATIAAAEAGLGITRVLSYQVEAAVKAGRLTLLLPAFTPPPVPVSVVWPSNRQAAVNVTAFVTAARTRFRAHPLVPAALWGVG